MRKTDTRRLFNLDDLKARCDVEYEDGCWTLRTKCRDHDKVALTIHGQEKKMRLGAAIYLLKHGVTMKPRRVYVSTCDNKFCANPKHRKSMSLSAFRSERNTSRTPKARAALMRYSREHRAKLTLDQVRQIKESVNETQLVLAERFGVSRAAISKIRRGITWRETVALSSVFSLGAFV